MSGVCWRVGQANLCSIGEGASWARAEGGGRGGHGQFACAQIVGSAAGDCSARSTSAFLPGYSPDLNPIEKMWSKVKQLLRGFKAWSDDELFTAIGQALDKVTASDAKGWFVACWYRNFQS